MELSKSHRMCSLVGEHPLVDYFDETIEFFFSDGLGGGLEFEMRAIGTLRPDLLSFEGVVTRSTQRCRGHGR